MAEGAHILRTRCRFVKGLQGVHNVKARPPTPLTKNSTKTRAFDDGPIPWFLRIDEILFESRSVTGTRSSRPDNNDDITRLFGSMTGTCVSACVEDTAANWSLL